MAGMLPGVESARRRRIHQSSGSSLPCLGDSGGGHGYTRHHAFCLCSGNHETWSLIVLGSSFLKREGVDEKLGTLAREAKERLDERLRAAKKSGIRRSNGDVSEESLRPMNIGKMEMITKGLQTEVFGSKRGDQCGAGRSKRLSWARLGWKPWEQEECAVCLEEFKMGENLVNLPCAHKFHSRCLVPWLDNNSHCPCCRKIIFS
ncbi:hypothetical protein Droror1_Dr00023949 [Drosera rotundifolia]